MGRVPTEGKGWEAGRGAAVKPENGARRKEVLEGARGGMFDGELWVCEGVVIVVCGGV